MSKRPVLYLIDGHAVAYRQYFALPARGFSTRSGEPTNATFGFTRILLDILQNDKPRYLALTFDRGLSGRDKVFDEYKGTREKMEDDLARQLPRIEEVVSAFNIPILALDGYEADDVIGTIAKQASEQDVDVHIITGDRDILQLLSPNVRVQLPQRNASDIAYDEAMFREKYDGLEPLQLIDLKALMGDSSDNIPGVKGIGQKGGTKLLLEYGSLDNIYANLDNIKGANHKKLTEGREMAYLSYELATILTDVDVQLDLEACVAQDYDVMKVDKLFGELEFRQLRDRLGLGDIGQLPLFKMADSDSGAPEPEEVVPTVIVQDEKALADLVETLNGAEAITWDVETTGIDPSIADLVGIALAVDGETGYYIPVGHDEGVQLTLDTVIEAIRPALTNPNIPKIAHNATYDLVVMQRYGVDVAPIEFDTMLAEWVFDPISRFLGLKNLARQRLGVHMTEIDELLGTGKKQKTMNQISIERSAPYAAADAALTHRLVEPLKADLEKDSLYDLFKTLDMPMVPVIADMEQTGVALDVPYLNEMSKELDAKIQQLEADIYRLGESGKFNINSPKQLNEVLFEKLQLPVEGLKKTTHGYSTNVVTLEILRDKHEIIEHIFDFRELSKLKSTYVDALPELVNPKTGRVHTSYNQTGSSSGRFSSSNPNLQNIPIRTEEGRKVRKAFVAPEGRVLLAVDYSQIELRVMAHISEDKTLIDAFMRGEDIHQATAASVSGISLEEVTYEQRSFAKRVNFGLMYGMGAFRLARDSELTLAEANEFIDTYFERMPGVQSYIDETKKLAEDTGEVATLFGRRREFPSLKAKRKGQSAQAELRAAINMPIQGTAADILKKAMLNLYDELNKQRQSSAKMILQVHDELVLEVPEGDLESTKNLVVDVMENAYEMRVPLKANASFGTNWLELEELE